MLVTDPTNVADLLGYIIPRPSMHPWFSWVTIISVLLTSSFLGLIRSSAFFLLTNG